MYRQLIDKGWPLQQIDEMDFWRYVHISTAESKPAAKEEPKKTYDFLLM